MNELDNSCRFIGRLVRDPELRYTPSGSPVLNFDLAVDQRVYDSQSQGYAKGTLWVNRIVVWGKMADTMNNLLQKGTQVAVDLEMSNNEYEKDGIKIRTYQFKARYVKVLAKGKGWGENNGGGDGEFEGGNEFYADPTDDSGIPF